MAPGERSVDARVYRAALRLCPTAFRREYADEMTRDFADARDEAAGAGGRAVWRLRLLMAFDLARTAAVQWTRTGWPVIALTSVACALVVAEGMASVARRAVFDIPADTEQAELMGLVLLAATSVCLIAMTIVLTLWVGRSTRRRRR